MYHYMNIRNESPSLHCNKASWMDEYDAVRAVSTPFHSICYTHHAPHSQKRRRHLLAGATSSTTSKRQLTPRLPALLLPLPEWSPTDPSPRVFRLTTALSTPACNRRRGSWWTCRGLLRASPRNRLGPGVQLSAPRGTLESVSAPPCFTARNSNQVEDSMNLVASPPIRRDMIPNRRLTCDR